MASKKARQKTDFHAEVTNSIIEMLEAGVRPWVRPWGPQYRTHGGAKGSNSPAPMMLPLRSTGEPYTGVNVVILWGAAYRAGYRQPMWMTFKQAQALGGTVRKGEKSVARICYSERRKVEKTIGGKVEFEEFQFTKWTAVFNVEQIEGLPARCVASFDPLPPLQAKEAQKKRIAGADSYFGSIGADVRHGGQRAYCAWAGDGFVDYIKIPKFADFRSAEDYYATLAHEHIHWTGRPSRLARPMGGSEERYAREELIAEIGAAFLCAGLGISANVRDDHAAYLAFWLKALRDDKRAIFEAAHHAQKSVRFLQDRYVAPPRRQAA